MTTNVENVIIQSVTTTPHYGRNVTVSKSKKLKTLGKFFL